MNKSLFSFILLLVCNVLVHAQTGYKVFIDLTAADNDQLPVTINPPAITSDTVEYHMAKVVPGTYSVSDFGRFVTDFQAIDTNGNELPTEQLSTNRWKISNAKKLSTIKYKVHDTWDMFIGYDEPIIFEPGGSNINAEKDVFMMNTFCFIGYVDGLKFQPYSLSIKHSEQIFGSTALKKEQINATEDQYFADDFNFLADGPIMYCVPDTVSHQIGNANVLVSTYSPNKKLSSSEVMEKLVDLMEAQSAFLGGQLPVDRYAFLLCLNDKMPISGKMGALEHSYSSFYSLPDAGVGFIGQTVRDVAAHEFFHIVTPLNIHSKEIGEFDYIDPKMSKHLWLYEGVTEYNSMLVQVKYDLYGPTNFLEEIKEKLKKAESYEDVSFTYMSEHILEPEWQEMYENVYYKGALIGMCLDLYILKYSNGEKNLQWLIGELSKKYGKDVSFDDDQLFDDIEDLTYPEVRAFLDKYVEGSEPLPVIDVLSWAGVEYTPYLNVKEISMGAIGLNINEDSQFFIEHLMEANEFAKDLGYKKGDIILEFNGEKFSLETAQHVVENFKSNTKAGDKVTVMVQREIKGKTKEKKLKAKAIEIEKKEKHFLELMKKPSQEQYDLLRAWIVAKK